MKRRPAKRIGRPPLPDPDRAKRTVIYLREDQRRQLELHADGWRGSVSGYVKEVLTVAKVIAR